ncbi:MAG TPA: hypothetical protein VFE38_06370 [Edaphobacter sp.]|nr:hypothetical protein [Edaphobacter sp.]
MVRRYLLLASPLVLACMFSSVTASASPLHSLAPVHAMFAKTKTVKLSLRNTTQAPISLHAGEQNITVEAGKTVPVDLPAGTRITTAEATGKHPAGTLIIEVYTGLNGATVDLN